MTARDLMRSLRNRLMPVRPLAGDSPDQRIVPGVKLYREVRIGPTRYRGSRDSLARPVDYVFDVLPRTAYAGARVLDIGTAGGAVCFGAIERGASRAVGLEVAAERIRGARLLKRVARVRNVEFLAEDAFAYLASCVAEFDVVFALNVLHHLPNVYPLLRRIARASRRCVVIEGPVEWTAGEYSSYDASLTTVDDVDPIRSLDGIARFMSAAGFEPLATTRPPEEAKFFRDQSSGRGLISFERRATAHEGLAALELYREPRTRSFQAARADATNIDVAPGTPLPEALEAHFGREWAAGMNFVLAGPRGSGKSHFAKQFRPDQPQRYNGKIFKSPDAGGRDGLARHLNPPVDDANYAAEALIGPSDDIQAHCSIEVLAEAIKGRRVVCLLLNVPFDEHVRRLAAREAMGQPVDYDISLRFNCAAAARILNQAGVAYRVVSVWQPVTPP